MKIKSETSRYWKKLLHLKSVIPLNILDFATTGGKFSLLKCYEKLSNCDTIFTGYKQIWNKLSMPKHRFLFWLAVKNKLLTRDRLITYIPDIEIACPVYDHNLENHDHLFFQCRFAKQLVEKVCAWIGFFF